MTEELDKILRQISRYGFPYAEAVAKFTTVDEATKFLGVCKKQVKDLDVDTTEPADPTVLKPKQQKWLKDAEVHEKKQQEMQKNAQKAIFKKQAASQEHLPPTGRVTFEDCQKEMDQLRKELADES